MATQRAATDIRSQVSPEEWKLRVDLAAAYRLVALYGWDDLVFTHISARVPGPEEHFLINPYGWMFEEITASSLVKVDLNCNRVIDSPAMVNPAGFLIHSTVHEARHDVGCVMHTHSLNGVAVSCQREGVLPLSQQSMFVLSSLAYHDYEGVALNPEEKARLVADYGDKTFFMLRNHGLLTSGKSIPDAFIAMYMFEAACTIQVRAQSAGRENLLPIPQFILDIGAAQVGPVTLGMGGALAWPGLLRKLDRVNPGYAD